LSSPAARAAGTLLPELVHGMIMHREAEITGNVKKLCFVGDADSFA
jgi:hypothetical protein